MKKTKKTQALAPSKEYLDAMKKVTVRDRLEWLEEAAKFVEKTRSWRKA